MVVLYMSSNEWNPCTDILEYLTTNPTISHTFCVAFHELMNEITLDYHIFKIDKIIEF